MIPRPDLSAVPRVIIPWNYAFKVKHLYDMALHYKELFGAKAKIEAASIDEALSALNIKLKGDVLKALLTPVAAKLNALNDIGVSIGILDPDVDLDSGEGSPFSKGALRLAVSVSVDLWHQMSLSFIERIIDPAMRELVCEIMLAVLHSDNQWFGSQDFVQDLHGDYIEEYSDEIIESSRADILKTDDDEEKKSLEDQIVNMEGALANLAECKELYEAFYKRRSRSVAALRKMHNKLKPTMTARQTSSLRWPWS